MLSSFLAQIKSLGFKSVAHYLIMTKRAPPNSDRSAQKPHSAKRSLPFKDMVVSSDDRSRQELNMGVPADNGSKQELTIEGMSDGLERSRKRSKKDTSADNTESAVANVGSSEEDSIARGLRSRSRT